jgi:TPR repeat protein
MEIKFKMSDRVYEEQATPVPDSTGTKKNRIHLFQESEGIKDKYSIAGEIIRKEPQRIKTENQDKPPQINFYDKLRGYVIVKNPENEDYYKLNLNSIIKRLNIDKKEIQNHLTDPAKLGELIKDKFLQSVEQEIQGHVATIYLEARKRVHGDASVNDIKYLTDNYLESIPHYLHADIKSSLSERLPLDETGFVAYANKIYAAAKKAATVKEVERLLKVRPNYLAQEVQNRLHEQLPLDDAGYEAYANKIDAAVKACRTSEEGKQLIEKKLKDLPVYLQGAIHSRILINDLYDSFWLNGAKTVEDAEKMCQESLKSVPSNLQKEVKQGLERKLELTEINLAEIFEYALEDHDVQKALEKLKQLPQSMQNDVRDQVCQKLINIGDAYRDNDPEKTVKYYRIAKTLGGAVHQHQIGNLQTQIAAQKIILKASEEGIQGQDFEEKLKNFPERWRSDARKYMAQELIDRGYAEFEPQKALVYFQKAAEMGDVRGYFHVGLLYDEGKEGVTQNFHEAIKWYKKGAEQGHSGCQYKLGLMYENGQGVKRSKQKAIEYFNLAAAQKHDLAKAKQEHYLALQKNLTEH